MLSGLLSKAWSIFGQTHTRTDMRENQKPLTDTSLCHFTDNSALSQRLIKWKMWSFLKNSLVSVILVVYKRGRILTLYWSSWRRLWNEFLQKPTDFTERNVETQNLVLFRFLITDFVKKKKKTLTLTNEGRLVSGSESGLTPQKATDWAPSWVLEILFSLKNPATATSTSPAH